MSRVLPSNVIPLIPPPDSNIKRVVDLKEGDDVQMLIELRSFLRKAPYPEAVTGTPSPSGNLTMNFESSRIVMHLLVYSHSAFTTTEALSVDDLCDQLRDKGYSATDLNLASKIANFLAQRGYELRTRRVNITKNAHGSLVGLTWTPTVGYEHVHVDMFRYFHHGYSSPPSLVRGHQRSGVITKLRHQPESAHA